MQGQSNKPTFSGNLSQISFPKLLYHLAAAKVIGRLIINRNEKTTVIRFNLGTPYWLMKDVDISDWATHLTKERLISASQLPNCIKSAQGKPEQLGAILLEQKLLSSKQISKSLREVFFKSTEDTFTWRAGQYAFFQEKSPIESAWKVNIEPWFMVVQGVRYGYTKDELSLLLRPYMKWFLGRKHNPHLQLNDLELLPEEQEIFQLASRNMSLENLISQYATNDQFLAMILPMVYLGLEIDLLSLSPEAPSKPKNSQPAQPADTDTETHLNQAEQTWFDLRNQLEKQDYFTRLGLEKTSGATDIARAFLKIAKKYHPDSLPMESSAKLKSLAQEVFSLFNEAHQKLSDGRIRSEYLAALEAGFDEDQVDIRNIVEAENMLDKAEVLIKAKNYSQALKIIEKAIELNPDEGEFQIYRGYIMFLCKPDAKDGLKREYMDVIKAGLKSRDMRVAKGYVFLGRIENSLGNGTKAEEMYKRALEIDQNDMEAARELRLLDMRKSKGTKKPKKWPWRK